MAVAELTRFTLPGGSTVLVETPDPSRVVPAGHARAVGDAAQPLRDALASVTTAASDILGSFRSMPHGPHEVEIQLGVSFDAKFGMVIASASTAGHLEVTLRWTGNPEP
jgi:Trypsin-co-occurring domain 1